MNRRRIVQHFRPRPEAAPVPQQPAAVPQPAAPVPVALPVAVPQQPAAVPVAGVSAVQPAGVGGVPEWQKYNPDINEELVQSSAAQRASKVKEYHRQATNVPYKPVTQVDLNKRYCEQKDLALEQDRPLDERSAKELLEAAMRERGVLDAKVTRYYSSDRKAEHAKQFEFTQKQIYRRPEEVQGTDALVKDRKEFYSKASEASEARKQQFNSLLEDLTRLGVSLPAAGAARGASAENLGSNT